jgi:UDP-N-acetylmuramoylalanine--D-glutamate ligase
LSGAAGGRAVVVGLGAAGEAVAAALARHGYDVVVTEDAPTDAKRALAVELGVTLVERPDAAALAALVRGAALVSPSPAVPPRHPAFGLAHEAGVPVVSEFELAAWWSDLPIAAITGTDGKTTVTTMVASMLDASGRRALDCGNNDLPLVAAIERDVDVLVVEASSFRLQLTSSFHPAVGTWLNFAADHLDWHASLEQYAAAKANIWAAQGPDDVAVANADDEVVMRFARAAPSRVVTFGLGAADFRIEGGRLLAPAGDVLAETAALWRSLPHDLANGLAASATALAAGATLEGVRQALLDFRGLPHRVSLVGEAAGVAWYDDSKATAPHAALTAVRGFDSVVLIAGGRNKGLDLSVLTEEAGRLRAVVAIGEAAPELERAFAGVRPVVVAASMPEAVAAAASLARPGDVVLLSPGCASFDWYRNYGERGDDFVRAVRALAS